MSNAKTFRPIKPTKAQQARYGSNAPWYRYFGRSLRIDRVAMIKAGWRAGATAAALQSRGW